MRTAKLLVIVGALMVVLATLVPCGAGTKTFLDVGKQQPITILIHQSPWYAGFEQVVKLYEEQTGNKVNLDVNPWSGVLEKARNAVRGGESPYDIVNLDAFVVVEFYAGGFLAPLNDIDPGFKLPPEVFEMNDTMYWNEKTRWTDRNGKLMTFSPNGNVQFLYYRADLYEKAGLKPPDTWDDVIEACKKLHNPPNLYCIALGAEKGSRVSVDFKTVMGGFGGSVEKDPAKGDFTVTINSPEVKKALDLYKELLTKYGPQDIGSIGQGQLIQYMVTGKAANAIIATAAWPNMDDPKQSQVVDKVNVTLIPMPKGGQRSVILGNWLMGVPQNIPDARKKAAIAFAKWFLTYDAQYKYAEFRAVPVRKDVLSSDLAKDKRFRWFETYAKLMPVAKNYHMYAEGPQIDQVLGLRLNQALIGQMSTGSALNTAAEEIYRIFEKGGRKTGMLPKLPE
jgi:multiple sugar transport system substrate-binding protein